MKLRDDYKKFQSLVKIPFCRRFGDLDFVKSDVPDWPISCTTRSDECKQYIQNFFDPNPKEEGKTDEKVVEELRDLLFNVYEDPTISDKLVDIENIIAKIIEDLKKKGADSNIKIVIEFLNMVLSTINNSKRDVPKKCSFVLFFIARALDYVFPFKNEQWKKENSTGTDVCELLCGLLWRKTEFTMPFFDENKENVFKKDEEFWFSIYSYLIYYTYGCLKQNCYFWRKNQLIRNMLVYFNRFYKDSYYTSKLEKEIKVFVKKFLDCDVWQTLLFAFNSESQPWEKMDVTLRKHLKEHLDEYLSKSSSMKDTINGLRKLHTLESCINVVSLFLITKIILY